MQGEHRSLLNREAMGNVGTLALASLGVGAGLRGAVGLYNVLKNNFGKPKRTRSGPALMGLPYPVAKTAADAPGHFLPEVTQIKSLPWYGPAMMFGGLASLGAGWKGVDMLLKRRARKDREAQLSAARQQFHDALVSQYDKPYTAAGPVGKLAADRAESGAPASALGVELDRLYAGVEKAAALWGTIPDDLAGQSLGWYGMLGGGAAALTGAIVYDKLKKRQQRAILEKALLKRERRRFNQQPTEITAIPEPFHQPAVNRLAEMRLLRQPPADPEPILTMSQ